ncbi:MAG: molybdopterin oxidoreductase, partial [Thermoproteus sp.]|nr:molybdopterin oxidoreductase [Thermoproteus sp.]
LEKEDVIYSYWHNLLVYNGAVAEPPGDARPEHWVVREIGKALGLESPLLAEDPWDAVRIALRPAGIDLEELKARKVVALRRGNPLEFKTPTGKIEFYSKAAEGLGLPPLPKYVGPKGRWVLTFTSEPLHTNSQFSEEYGPPEPVAYVNPASGLDGVICLEAKGVRVRVRAVADAAVPPGVILMRGIPKSLDGVPVNALTEGAPNPYGGTPRVNYSVVEVATCKTEDSERA